MRDALDVGEGLLFGKGAHQMRASCQQEMSDEEIPVSFSPWRGEVRTLLRVRPRPTWARSCGAGGCPKGGCPKGGPKFCAFFFPLPPPFSFFFFSLWEIFSCLFFSLWWSSRGIVLVDRDPQMCAFSPVGRRAVRERAVIWNTHTTPTQHTHTPTQHTHTNSTHTHQQDQHQHSNNIGPKSVWAQVGHSLREARTSRYTTKYGHRGTRVGEAAHPGPTRRLSRVVDAQNVVRRLSPQATVDSSDSDDEMPLMRRSIGPQDGLEQDFGGRCFFASNVRHVRRKLSGAKGVSVLPHDHHVVDVTLRCALTVNGEAHPKRCSGGRRSLLKSQS